MVRAERVSRAEGAGTGGTAVPAAVGGADEASAPSGSARDVDPLERAVQVVAADREAVLAFFRFLTRQDNLDRYAAEIDGYAYGDRHGGYQRFLQDRAPTLQWHLHLRLVRPSHRSSRQERHPSLLQGLYPRPG
mgnify:CR=1 FL=1